LYSNQRNGQEGSFSPTLTVRPGLFPHSSVISVAIPGLSTASGNSLGPFHLAWSFPTVTIHSVVERLTASPAFSISAFTRDFKGVCSEFDVCAQCVGFEQLCLSSLKMKIFFFVLFTGTTFNCFERVTLCWIRCVRLSSVILKGLFSFQPLRPDF
jgi:hypothetical protein